jgi:hypothetical protein
MNDANFKSEMARAERISNAVGAVCVGLTGGGLALNCLLLAVAPTPFGLFMTSVALTAFVVTVVLS